MEEGDRSFSFVESAQVLLCFPLLAGADPDRIQLKEPAHCTICIGAGSVCVLGVNVCTFGKTMHNALNRCNGIMFLGPRSNNVMMNKTEQ